MFTLCNNLMLDYNTVRNLEITKTLHDGKKYGSLLWLLDKTKTSMGARKLSEWLLYPLNNVEDINERLEAVKAFFDNTLIRTSLTEILSTIKDIGRISGKILPVEMDETFEIDEPKDFEIAEHLPNNLR